MKRYDCIFLDRDGTLNPDPGYIKCINEFQFYSFTIKSLIKLAKDKGQYVIVSIYINPLQFAPNEDFLWH